LLIVLLRFAVTGDITLSIRVIGPAILLWVSVVPRIATRVLRISYAMAVISTEVIVALAVVGAAVLLLGADGFFVKVIERVAPCSFLYAF
jgi:lysylphosphatidylglycerol synthetase-like protein (DUF2156 family)